ncbi:hypothetical protein ILUMI_12591 [Ignelater luminosus]|uniref:Gustatory receptor n=1 Tax=Ignelater luminosus TaxID=2038154 RepID=A0A8K0CW56_IGNLU|nr:hypothetical protein ILUMI_12591 [Ignelater luminosus]
MFQPKTFYSVLSPMYFTTFLIGLTPFSVHTPTFKKSKFYLLWSILIMIFLNTYTTLSLTKRTHRKLEVISQITDSLDLILGQLGTCFGILGGCTSLNKILNVFENIDNFDKTVETVLQIDLRKEYRKSAIYILVGLLVSVIYIIATFIVTSMANGQVLDYIGLYLAYICPPLINTFVDFQFCTLILCLKQRFTWLNKTVKETSCIHYHSKTSKKGFIRIRPAVQV